MTQATHIRGQYPLAPQKCGMSKVIEDELYEMLSIYPADSGLPMTVWAEPRGNARHDVRVKVNMAHGNRISIANAAVVAVRPAPRLDRRAVVLG
jgi:hypothetical protein